jgi:hypothetical protein
LLLSTNLHYLPSLDQVSSNPNLLISQMNFWFKVVSLHNQLVGGGDPHIKTMLEWSIAHKHKKVIKHEIMVHHNFPRPISSKSTYTMKQWKEVEVVNTINCS